MSFYLEIIYAMNNCISKFLTTKTTVDLTDVLYWFLPPLHPPCVQYGVTAPSLVSGAHQPLYSISKHTAGGTGTCS